jgi:hypothetical protein
MTSPIFAGLVLLGTAGLLLAHRRLLTGRKVAVAVGAVGSYLAYRGLRSGQILLMAREYFHRPHRRSAAADQVQRGLTKAEAEQLLDWLEANGHGPAQVSYQDGQGFTVRYR